MVSPRRWSVFYAAYFTMLGLWVAFGASALMSASPQWAGASLAGVSMGYFVASPASRWAWSRLGFRSAMSIYGVGACASVWAWVAVPWAMPALAPLVFFFGTGANSICETKMLEDLAKSGRGHEFGAARKWGSLGFLAASLLGGLALDGSKSNHDFFLAMGFCSVFYMGACFWLAASGSEPAASGELVAPEEEPVPEEAEPGDVPYRPEPALARFGGSTAIGAMRLAEAAATTWFGAYWMSTGHSAAQTGALCALPVAAEFLAMWKGARYLSLVPLPLLLLVCSAASSARWLATGFCSELWCAAPLQTIHALSFGFFYPASLLWMKAEYGEGFFRARYWMEVWSRAASAGLSFLAANVLLRLSGWGYPSIFWGVALISGAAALWWAFGARVLPGRKALPGA